MTRPNPAPQPTANTTEEQRAFHKQTERQRDLEELDRPSRWDY